MKKHEAADYLGITPRALEYHVKQKNIGVRYVKGATGDIADFDEGELRKLKAKMEAKRAPSHAVTREEDERPETEPRSLMRLSDAGAQQEFVLLLASAIQAAQKAERAPTLASEAAHKVMLTLQDAAALSSLSRNHLLEAIHAGKLKAKIVGRGWRVKRDDLDAYVKKL